MRNPIKILLLTLILGISSCSSSFIVRTKEKKITLISLPADSIKVGLDNGKAIIKFNRNDLVELFESDLKEFTDQRIKSYVDDLKSLKSDKIYIKDKTIGTLPLSEYELKFHTLILKGKAEIQNKKTEENLKRIKYKYTRDKLGGENAYFYSGNGVGLYEILLALGE
ncbi:hypothetical protein [Flagellimonas halotolerans]|uniref:Lipoprotein n=1 Tax=Flagellimonas halotolerans TaxID=3112164 RepID=A0ABU6IRA3_9FLAO|nr:MULTISPECIES: hypothetical protein [unclassified Allomuricauda]MEC3965579.1 hypothetical protein [Muricauda sp. SYSU M86414]MEC4265445.1 hypothetical protein [Muricauda sp. SYSU M84420]